MPLVQFVELCLLQLLRSAGAVLLQREIPEEVNVHVASIAAAAGVPVLLDCGGVEGPISSELLKNITILSPNETELARLTGVHLISCMTRTVLCVLAAPLHI